MKESIVLFICLILSWMLIVSNLNCILQKKSTGNWIYFWLPVTMGMWSYLFYLLHN